MAQETTSPKLETLPTESRRQSDKLDSDKLYDVKNNMDSSTVTEVIDTGESVETNDKIEEVLTDTKDVKGDGFSTKHSSKKEIDELKKKLLKDLPPENVMRTQVEREIKSEIAYLRKRALKLIRPPYKRNMSYFEMTNLLKKIRDLKGVLFSLVKITTEGLKALWLRFVHGIM